MGVIETIQEKCTRTQLERYVPRALEKFMGVVGREGEFSFALPRVSRQQFAQLPDGATPKPATPAVPFLFFYIRS